MNLATLNPDRAFKAQTKDGELFVKDYLHPPSRVGAPGIPDHATNASVPMRFAAQNTIGPTGLVIPGNQSWGCLILHNPNPAWPIIVIKWVGDYPSTATIGNNLQIQVFPNAEFAFGTNGAAWDAAVAKFRPIAASATVKLDVADLYNQGQVYVAQFPSDFYDQNEGLTKLIKSTVEILSANNAKDGPKRSTHDMIDLIINESDYFLGNPAAGTFATKNKLQVLPDQGSAITTLSTQSYAGLARDGSYAPLKFQSPTLDYQGASPRWESITGAFPSNGLPVNHFSPNGVWGSTGELVVPTYEGMMGAFHLYKNLLPQASLTVKTIHSWECLIHANSTLSSFKSDIVYPDRSAIEEAFSTRARMPDGFPAAANDFGALWSGIKQYAPALKKVWDLAKPALKTGISALPGGGLVNQVISGLEDVINRPTVTPRKSKAKTEGKTIEQLQKEISVLKGSSQSKGGNKKKKK